MTLNTPGGARRRAGGLPRNPGGTQVLTCRPATPFSTPGGHPEQSRVDPERPGVERGCFGVAQGHIISPVIPKRRRLPDGPCQTRMAPAKPGLRPNVPPKLHRSQAGSHPGDARATPWLRPGHAQVTPKSHPGNTQVKPKLDSRTCPFYTRVGPKAHPSHTRVTLRLLPVTHTMHRGYTQSAPKSPRSNTRVTSGLHPDYALVLPWFRPACTPPGFHPG